MTNRNGVKIMKYILLLFFIVSSASNSINQNTKDDDGLYQYDVEEKIRELGIELEVPNQPKNNLVLSVQSGNLIFLSGNGPITDEKIISGKVGRDLTIEQGYEAARLTAINQISILKNQIGDLNKVERIVKVFGMVNADPSFKEHPKVINGFSDLMVEVFGDRGKHARSAVGMASLPWNIACEVELIVQIQE
jgi:enamine deaminase RidA (YjgF/YER057c/UK114 family)